MDNFIPEQFKEIVKELVSKTSCSVCVDTVQPPVHLCIDGHGICGPCRIDLDKCPTCAQPFSSNTSDNLLLNKVLDLHPHKCRYDGCKEFNPSGDEHSKWCGYRPTTCKLNKCEWTGCGKDISQHIYYAHGVSQVMREKGSKCFNPEVVLDDTTCTPLYAYGNFFWIIMSTHDKNVVAVKFVYVPNNKMKNPLKITLGFEKSKKSLSSSIYVTPENVLDEEETSMSFVYSRVESLIHKVNDLNGLWNKKFFTISITVQQD